MHVYTARHPINLLYLPKCPRELFRQWLPNLSQLRLGLYSLYTSPVANMSFYARRRCKKVKIRLLHCESHGLVIMYDADEI